MDVAASAKTIARQSGVHKFHCGVADAGLIASFSMSDGPRVSRQTRRIQLFLGFGFSFVNRLEVLGGILLEFVRLGLLTNLDFAALENERVRLAHFPQFHAANRAG